MLSALVGRHGVESVAVNTIGRYCVVRHCPVECCAPVAKIVALLNAERLGAAVQESGTEGEEDGEGEGEGKGGWLAGWLGGGRGGLRGTIARACFAVLLLALFFVGVGVQDQTGEHSTATVAIFLLNTCLGSLPVMRAAFVSSVIRRTLDIHTLILVAVAGALASGEYLDAALVVSLFEAAELVEEVVLLYVRR